MDLDLDKLSCHAVMVTFLLHHEMQMIQLISFVGSLGLFDVIHNYTFDNFGSSSFKSISPFLLIRPSNLSWSGDDEDDDDEDDDDDDDDEAPKKGKKGEGRKGDVAKPGEQQECKQQ